VGATDQYGISPELPLPHYRYLCGGDNRFRAKARTRTLRLRAGIPRVLRAAHTYTRRSALHHLPLLHDTCCGVRGGTPRCDLSRPFLRIAHTDSGRRRRCVGIAPIRATSRALQFYRQTHRLLYWFMDVWHAASRGHTSIRDAVGPHHRHSRAAPYSRALHRRLLRRWANARGRDVLCDWNIEQRAPAPPRRSPGDNAYRGDYATMTSWTNGSSCTKGDLSLVWGPIEHGTARRH